jgi:two-component system sensor histidine kinase HupT/HoxJ
MNHDDCSACNGDFPDLHAIAEQDVMQALGLLSSGIAHELNTPLGAIGCAVSTHRMARERFVARVRELAPPVLDDPEIRRSLEAFDESERIVAAGLQRVIDLVGHMRRFLHRDAVEPGPVDIAALVDGALLLAAHQLRRNVKVEKETAGSPVAWGFPNHVGQILLNLVVNASQALADREGRLVITTREDDGFVAISVADDGPGVPPEVGDRVFEFGYTSRVADGGTGFGLSLSKHLACRMGGDLTLAAAPGGGAVFTLRLPRPPAGSDAGS